MDKKIILGLLALSSVSAFAEGGFVETNNKVEFTAVESNKKSDEHKIDAAVFLGNNKEFVVFSGVKGEFLGSTKLSGYLGGRVDTKIFSNSRLSVTGVINEGSVLDRAIVEQLKADRMKNWDGKKDKNDILLKNGVRINKKDANENAKESLLLLSAVLDHKLNKADVNYGVIYNVDNSKPADGANHRIESFAGLKTKFNVVDVEANIDHVMGNYRALQYAPEKDNDSFIDFEASDKYNSSFADGGRLKGDVKLSGKVSDISLSSKLSVNHSDVAKAYAEKAKVNVLGGIENRASYNKDGLKVDGNLDYKFKLHVDKTEANKEKSALLHTPEAVLKLEKSFNNYKFRSNTKDVANAQQLLYKVSDDFKYAKFGNLFYTDNIVERKYNDNLTLGLRVKALNDINVFKKMGNKDSEPVNNFAIDTRLAIAPVAKYSLKVNDLSVNSKSSLGYVLKYDAVSDKENEGYEFDHTFDHNILAYSLNEIKYKVNDSFKFESNINVANDLIFSSSTIIGEASNSEIKETKELTVKPTEEELATSKEGIAVSNILNAQLRFKPIYENVNGITLSAETNLYASLVDKSDFGFAVTVDPELKYVANKTITFGTKLGLGYNNRLESKSYIKSQFNAAEELLFGNDISLDKSKDVKFEDHTPVAKGDLEKAIDSELEAFGKYDGQNDLKENEIKSDSTKETYSTLNINPSAWISLNFLENKLTVEPKFEVGVNYKQLNSEDSLQLKKVTGKGTLKIEYKW